jgi:outer membrane protein
MPSQTTNISASRPTWRVLLPICIILLFAGSLAASAPQTLTLTLRQAVTLALRQSPEVQIANIKVATSEEDRSIARSSMLPQVQGGVSEEFKKENLATILGRPAPAGIAFTHGFQVVQGGATGSVPVFDLTLWSHYKASQYAVDSTRAQRMSTREQIVLLVVSQYLGCLQAHARVQAAQSRVELAQALYKLAADRESSGVGTKLDALRANVELKNEKQALIVAETLLNTSLYGLSRLLNVDPHEQIELADQLHFSEIPEANLDEELQYAYSDRPEMKSLRAQERQSDEEKKAARESRLPKVAVNATWSYAGLRPSDTVPVYQYAATLSVPLFTGGRIKAEITKSDLALKDLAQQEQDLRNRIALEVKTAAAQLQSAKHEVAVANSGIQLAQEAMTQARDRFAAGVANNIEVITAQDELSRASDNQIDALYRFNEARADLAHAMGRIETLYSK